MFAALASPVAAQTAAPTPSEKPAATAPASKASATRGTLLDINAASKEELEALPQIGSARADAIIKGRPYKSKDELRQKKIIPENAYKAIRGRIVARQKG